VDAVVFRFCIAWLQTAGTQEKRHGPLNTVRKDLYMSA
jgi:hypothetical protein